MGKIGFEEAEATTLHFSQDFPVVAQRMAFRFGRNAKELYGNERSQANEVIGMKAGYIPVRGVTPEGREYDGRIDVLLDNIADRNDLIQTLRHELFGHFSLNLFTGIEKSALLHSIIESRHEPSLGPYWDYVLLNYSDRSIDVQAEEVFARIFEHIQINPLLKIVGGYGADVFRETCIDRKRPIQWDDLLYIGSMVVQDLLDGFRPQQYFPQDDSLVFAGRIQNILSRTITTDISHTFYDAADTVMLQALDSLTLDWQAAEDETITRSIVKHGHKPDVVLKFLLENSPGAVTIEQQLELRKKISKLAPLPETQLAGEQSDSNDREFTP